MSTRLAFSGASIFTGEDWVEEKVLVVVDGKVEGLAAAVPAGARRIDAAGHLIVPGFVDLQVNGGGGVLLNEEPTVDGIRAILAAHQRFGTTALLPTLITDTPAVTARAIAAGLAAARSHLPGFIGLHLEGPHLSVARKGAHDPALIRPMENADLAARLTARAGMPALLVTLAPENATPEQVRALARAGVTVSLGHTDCTATTALAYVEAGARSATHLFNAMSQLGNREPGLVGAVLSEGRLSSGLIADGFHVDPITMRIALAAKRGPGRLYLVTDAMSTIGTDLGGLTLNGRHIRREGGRLTLEDGTLAGADIDMLSSVLFLQGEIGLDLDEALRMASLYPAEVIGLGDRKGRLVAGMDADFILLDASMNLKSTWIGGACVHQGGR